jgi:WD40 repeat protein
VEVYELPGGRLVRTGVDAVALLPDGKAVVSDAQRRLRIYSAGGVALADLAMPARMMALRRNATRMIALGSYTDIAMLPMVIDLESYRSLQLVGHVDKVLSARWVTGNRILTANQDGTARMWDAASGRQLGVFRGGTVFIGDATLLNDSIVVAGDADGPCGAPLRFDEVLVSGR